MQIIFALSRARLHPPLCPHAPAAGCRNPPLESRNELTPDEIGALNDYAVRTRVRGVKYGAWMTTVGYEPSPDAGNREAGLTWTEEAPLNGSGVARNTTVPGSGVWM